jgi:hypothetical protein
MARQKSGIVIFLAAGKTLGHVFFLFGLIVVIGGHSDSLRCWTCNREHEVGPAPREVAGR